MANVIQVKDKNTNEIKVAVYGLYRNKMLLHVDGKPYSDKDFNKKFTVIYG